MPHRACLVPVVLLAFFAGCTKFDALNATVPGCGYVRTTNLKYGDLPRQSLDVYRPKGVAPDARPGARVVVFFYGGDWQAGEKGDYRFVGQALASRGFVAVLPDYRLYPETKFPGFVEDGAKAVRWVRDHAAEFGGNPEHVFLMGHSAGAHIAALLTLDARYLQAQGLDRGAIRGTAALSGPYDFMPGSSDRAVFGMKPGDAPDPAIEPLHFVDGHAPPMLLLTGMKDDVVHPHQTVELVDAIRKAGGEARAIGYVELGHPGVVLAMAWSFRWMAPVLDDVASFVNRQDVTPAGHP